MAEITPLVIANRACAMFGQEPLQSLDEETLGGQRVALIYDSLVDFCLDLTPWTFQRETVALNRLANVTPPTGHSYAFVVPKGYTILPARLLFAQDPTAVIATGFEYEGDRLYCDHTQVWAQLQVRQHPERWSGAFRHAVTKALAAELALAMADDKQVSAALRDEAFGPPSLNFRGGLMGAAISANGRSSPSRSLPTSNPLLDAWSS